jgi:hypothetical protein
VSDKGAKWSVQKTNPVEAASTFSLGVFEDVGSLSELVAMSGEVSDVEVGVGVVFGVAIMTALVLDADVVMGDLEDGWAFPAGVLVVGTHEEECEEDADGGELVENVDEEGVVVGDDVDVVRGKVEAEDELLLGGLGEALLLLLLELEEMLADEDGEAVVDVEPSEDALVCARA